MTYDDLKLDDGQILDVLDIARAHGALAMIHAENADCIEWLTKRLEAAGRTRAALACTPGPCWWSAKRHPRDRAVRTGRRPHSHRARIGPRSDRADPLGAAHGLSVFAETCPQYLFLTAEDLGIDDQLQGARCVCSPPPRDKANQEIIWDGLGDGLFTVFSSDHAPFASTTRRAEARRPGGALPPRHQRHPGLETRLPLLFEACWAAASRCRSSSSSPDNPAKAVWTASAQGHHRGGYSDADLVVWDQRG